MGFSYLMEKSSVTIVRLFGAAFVAALSVGAAAHAAPLLPGSQINPATPQAFGGTQVATTGGNITTSTFSANYTSSVYSDPNNIFGSGLLDFVYQFTDVSGDAVERISASNFGTFLTNVGYSVVAGDVAPLVIDRSSNGNVIGFDFSGNGNVAAGRSSDFLVVQTNASNFSTGNMSLQDGTAGSGAGYTPTVAAAPEPGTWVLMLGGIGMLGAFLRMQQARRCEDQFASIATA